MVRRFRGIWAVAALLALAVVLALALGWFESEAPSASPDTTDSGATGSDTTPSTSVGSTSIAGSVTSTSHAEPGSTEPPMTTTSTTTTTTLPKAEDEVEGETPEDPVPMGQAIDLGTWQIGVSDVELDATETVLGFVDFNEPPDGGNQFVLVELSGVNLGNAISQPVFDWALVNDDFSHVPDGLECGVIPNSIYEVGDVTPGTQFTATLCFEIPGSEVSDPLVLSLDLLDRSQPTKFFLLR